MNIQDAVAELLAKAVRTGEIRSFGVVVVHKDGLVDRTAYCLDKPATTELHGAIALLAKGAIDFHERNWPHTVTPPE